MIHETCDDDDVFDRLPDEIVLQILNKLINLKTLCFCYVVCERFSSIVVQVDTISFITPPIDLDLDDDGVSIDDVKACFNCESSFTSAIESMNKFTGLKSFSMNLVFPPQKQERDNRYLLKWKVKSRSDKFGSFLCISTSSICKCNANNNGDGNHEDDNEEEEEEEDEEEEEEELARKKIDIIFKCLWDSVMRVILLLDLIETFPLLEKVSISDSAKMGTVSLGVSKIAKMRIWLLSTSGTIDEKVKHPKVTCWLSRCYIPLLELPVSGYLMKGVTLLILHKNNDSLVNIDYDDDFDDKEKIAYDEAVLKIFNKHMELVKTTRLI